MDEAVRNALENKEITKIIFDFDKVKYISSAGLRVLLKYKKEIDNIVVQNVSLDVNDIFEVTGFSQMLEVKKRFNQIDVSGCEIIGKGGVGTIYRLDSERIAKVFIPGYSIENVESEQRATQNTLVAGVPTMIPFEIAKSGENYAVVYELLDKDNYTNHVLAHPEKKMSFLRNMLLL